METFVGHIKTPQDALIVFEACRRGLLQRVKRRLSAKERMNIQSGSIFAFDESEAGMRRWTDGRTWSPSRVLGSFLTYRELDTKRRPRRNSAQSSSSPSTHGGAGGSIACSYKPHGLIKQSFSICTAYNQKMHLISYYSKADVAQGNLALPSMDPNLADVVIPKGLYPELNPLDTSGGHSATFHLMLKASIDEQQLQLGLHHTGNSNYSSRKRDTLMAYAQPPSLSSSPLSTCSEDDLLSPSHQTLTLLPHHHQQQQHQEQHHHQEHQRQQHQQQLRTTSITTSPPWPSPSATKQLTPASYHTSHHNHASLSPPAQAWKPYSLQSEDTRQLEALKTQLRI